jgi:hypothetical protein
VEEIDALDEDDDDEEVQVDDELDLLLNLVTSTFVKLLNLSQSFAFTYLLAFSKNDVISCFSLLVIVTEEHQMLV